MIDRLGASHRFSLERIYRKCFGFGVLAVCLLGSLTGCDTFGTPEQPTGTPYYVHPAQTLPIQEPPTATPDQNGNCNVQELYNRAGVAPISEAEIAADGLGLIPGSERVYEPGEVESPYPPEMTTTKWWRALVLFAGKDEEGNLCALVQTGKDDMWGIPFGDGGYSQLAWVYVGGVPKDSLPMPYALNMDLNATFGQTLLTHFLRFVGEEVLVRTAEAYNWEINIDAVRLPSLGE
jgi:hypothetical protein